jgi:hypothetical protein
LDLSSDHSGEFHDRRIGEWRSINGLNSAPGLDFFPGPERRIEFHFVFAGKPVTTLSQP